MIPLDAIRAAAERLRGHVHRTPLLGSATLGARIGAHTAHTGARLFLKCESLQKTGSFKARGALNKVLGLPPAPFWGPFDALRDARPVLYGYSAHALPRPRDQLATRELPGYLRVRHQLGEALRADHG